MKVALDYIVKKFGVDANSKPPIEIRNVNRTIMAQTLGELRFKVGAEIGVAQGWHSEMLCKNNPALKLYAIDIFEPYPGYREYTDRIDKYYRIAKRRMANYNCEIGKKFGHLTNDEQP